MEGVSEKVVSAADQLERKVRRARALQDRPTTNLPDNVGCAKCGKKIPVTALEHEIYKTVLVIDGQVYCTTEPENCAKQVAFGMQALMLSMNEQGRADHYKEIKEKIDAQRLRVSEEMRSVVDEINWDDAKSMAKALRNRDGSMETKSLFQKIKENVRKVIHKRSEKRIIMGVK